MKLRSIALAGLLGAGLLMTAGCDKEDVPFVNIASVSVVNGSITPNVNVVVDGNTQQVDWQDTFKFFPTTTTDDNINVSYEGGPNLSLNSEGTYIVGINTNCPRSDYVVDKLDANKLRVMNLSDNEQVQVSDVNITHDGVAIPLPAVLTECSTNSTYTGTLEGTWTLQINSGPIETVTIDSSNPTSGIELIIYKVDKQKGTVIPLI